MKGYKAFGKGLICRGKQYTENTVFEEDSAEICKRGMHFCENPLDCLDHYPLVDENGEIVEIAEVEALDEVKTDDKKIFCTKKLKIGAKLSLAKFIKASLDFLYEKTDNGCEKSAGADAQMASGGADAQMASEGNYVKMVSAGYFVNMASAGYSVDMASSGGFANMASAGSSVKMASSGADSQMASAGNSAKMASAGNYVKMASSGGSVKMASSGDCAQLASSGNYATLASSGNYAVICCAGHCSIAKGKKGTWITLAEWEWSDEEGTSIPVCVKTEQIDGVRIKENTFYKLENGEFVEVDE